MLPTGGRKLLQAVRCYMIDRDKGKLNFLNRPPALP